MDRADKMTAAALLDEMERIGLRTDVASELIESLRVRDITTLAARFSSADRQVCGGSQGVSDVVRLLELLDHYGVGDWVQFDASVVRGLAYYTGVVFEAFDRQGQFRAICGGGRYDGLLKQLFDVNGEFYPTAAAGFKVEDAELQALLGRRGLLPDDESLGGSRSPDIVLSVAAGDGVEACAYRLAGRLRDEGLSVDMQLLQPPRQKTPAAMGLVRKDVASGTRMALVRRATIPAATAVADGGGDSTAVELVMSDASGAVLSRHFLNADGSTREEHSGSGM